MSLRDFDVRLATIGIVLKAAPDSTHPALPVGDPCVLALQVPAGQAAALEEFDGTDPTEDVPPAGRRFRRILRELREDDDILAWRFFRNGSTGWLHMLVTAQQALQWHRNIDWVASTRLLEAPRPEHRFYGV